MNAAALAETHARAFRHGGAWSESSIAAAMSAPGAITAGCARAFALGRVTLDEAELLTLATAPEYQRQGHARAVLARFEALAAQAGARVIFLEVDAENTAARALYHAAGYTHAGLRRGYYRSAGGHVSDALLLKKALPSDVNQPVAQDSC